jgi:small ligand-binding sensory domain FIST
VERASAEHEISFASALSARPDTADAAAELCDRVQARRAEGSGPIDLGLLFFTAEHVPRAETLERLVHERLGVQTLIGVSAEGVLGDGQEIQRSPGAALLAGSLPGVELRHFVLHDLPRIPEDFDQAWAEQHVASVIGGGPSLAGTLLFTDPFSAPLVRVLPALSMARGPHTPPILGGVASAAVGPGQNVLMLNGGQMRAGGVGVSLVGPVQLDAVVSQGCRGFGPTMIVTKARGNVIIEIGGRPALDAVRDAVLELDPDRRKQIEGGLFVGRVINEYKQRFGRDDYLIRAVRGFDERARAILCDDFFRVGQTIRLHMRDAQTAEEDLGMLLDAQKLRPQPAGGLILAGAQRGAALFGRPNRDASAVLRAFSQPDSGVERAKSGEAIDVGREPPLATAGMFTSGEIGPVGGTPFLHSQSVGLGLFRRPPA